MIHRNRGNRRDITESKVERKKRIIHKLNDYWFYKHEGMLRKGKIHCSCPMCAAKTNAKYSKSRGPVFDKTATNPLTGNHYGRRGNRVPATNCRYGKKNWKISDRKKIDKYREQLKNLDQGLGG
jgi:hypothetical protein